MSRDIKVNPFLIFIRANVDGTHIFFPPDRNVNREQDGKAEEENYSAWWD